MKTSAEDAVEENRFHGDLVLLDSVWKIFYKQSKFDYNIILNLSTTFSL